jgi:hypothetical protein
MTDCHHVWYWIGAYTLKCRRCGAVRFEKEGAR